MASCLSVSRNSKPWHHGGKSRHERGYGRAWEKIRAVVLKCDKNGKPTELCRPCLERENRPTPATQVDHITPKAEGGSDEPDNLQAICTTCHDEKSKDERARANGHAVKARIGTDGWPI